jgi:hypothetical protein
MYMNRGWYKDFFYHDRLFYYLKLSSPSGILLTFSTLHAIRGYRRQRGLKDTVTNYFTASNHAYIKQAKCTINLIQIKYSNTVPFVRCRTVFDDYFTS